MDHFNPPTVSTYVDLGQFSSCRPILCPDGDRTGYWSRTSLGLLSYDTRIGSKWENTSRSSCDGREIETEAREYWGRALGMDLARPVRVPDHLWIRCSESDWSDLHGKQELIA